MQKIIRLEYPDRMRFETFIISDENRLACEALALLAADKNTARFVFLYGPQGSGKTHLLQAVLHDFINAGQACYPVSWRSQRSQNSPPELLTWWAELRPLLFHSHALVMDDIDLIPPIPELRNSLVDLFNHFSFTSKPVLLTAQLAPQLLLEFDDHLRSRFASGVTLALQTPSMATRATLLTKLARDRGLTLPEGALDYILTRCPRDIGSLLQLMAELDHYSLTEKKHLTLNLVRTVVARYRESANGMRTTADDADHADGRRMTADHADGEGTTADHANHAEGEGTTADHANHAEEKGTTADRELDLRASSSTLGLEVK